MRHRFYFPIVATMLAFCALAFAPSAAANNVYVRAALGGYRSNDANFSDVNCAQKQPPALFGCQTGSDGRPIGARGDFGHGWFAELGVGYRFLPWLRAEVLLSYRPNLEYSGTANFLKVTGLQPVNGAGESLAAFAVAWADLPAIGRWRPYVGFGAGVARNHIGPMTYGFPGLGEGALTRTSGGTNTGFAWFASVGVTFAVTPWISLDFGLRYSDLGEVRTASGPATIVRDSGVYVVDVGATRADLRASGAVFGFRYRF